MAKILGKILPSNLEKLTKLRQSYNWVKLEIDALEEELNEKKEQKLNKLKTKLNKQIEKSAFSASNKEELANLIYNEKLKSFDVKNYLNYRAINHGLSKNIFKSIKTGKSYEEFLIKQEGAILKQKKARDEFIKKLEANKQNFLQKNSTSDDRDYLKQKEELNNTYVNEEIRITAEFQDKLSKKKQKLQLKLSKLQDKINALQSSVSENKSLENDVLLSVKGLKMYFGGLKAVDDLTFDVKKSEIFGLIGPNGAGKTTVFNCITRFYNATDGEMYFENKQGEVVNLRSFKVHDIILQGISRTFQNVELVKEISVIDNLLVACSREYRSNLFVQALGLPVLKKEEKLLRAKAMKVLRFMGIESYANWLAFGLPYGILKKIEIARALMSDSKLIIMDEPAAGLNDSETKELAEIIKRIRDEFNTTILLVEHDMSLVMGICDTVCAISFGKMLAIGSTEEIKNNKAVQEAYLGVEED